MFTKRIAIILVVFLGVAGCGRLYYKQFIVGGDPFKPEAGTKTEHFDFGFIVEAESSWSRAPITDSTFRICVWVHPISGSKSQALNMIQTFDVLGLQVYTQGGYNVIRDLELTKDTTFLKRQPPSRLMCLGKHIVPEDTQLLELFLIHSFRVTEAGPWVVDTARVALHRSEGSRMAPYDH